MQHPFKSYESSDYATRYVNGRKVTRKKKSVVISTDSELTRRLWKHTTEGEVWEHSKAGELVEFNSLLDKLPKRN